METALQEKEPVWYAGIRLRRNRDELAQAVPDALKRLSGYFDQHGLTAAGAPLVRYLVVDYNDDSVEVDVGLPVDSPTIPADPHVQLGQLPGGTFATTLHRGSYDTLVDTTASLLDWAKQTGTHWHVATEHNVTWWAARVEHYLVGPPAETDPRKWSTEIAILLAR